MRSDPYFILGLNISHDATAVLINNTGEVVAGIAEERLTRNKYHETFPFHSINWLLQDAGLKASDINEVAYNWRNIGGSRTYRNNIFSFKAENIDWANKVPFSVSSFVALDYFLNNFRLYRKLFPKYTDIEHIFECLRICNIHTENVNSFDHQLCHAASAFYSSEFKQSLVLSVDGYGDDKSGGVYLAKDNQIRRLETISADVSAGAFYANVTGALGYRRNRHEGKITGLAAIGDSKNCRNLIRRHFGLDDTLRFTRTVTQHRDKFKERINMFKYFFRGKYEYIDSYYNSMKNDITLSKFSDQDIAAAAQDTLENAVTIMIEDCMDRYEMCNLALAGGVFSNVKLNQRISELRKVEHLFVHPNMGDGGGAYGAAMLAFTRTSKIKPPRIEDVFWGPDYSDENIKTVLEEHGYKAKYIRNIEETIADLLAKGMIVGRFNGKMEYGPRALGNRSILVEPSRLETNNELNERLGRTEFMPFAPVVMKEHGADLFWRFNETLETSKYMTITLDVRKEWIDRIAAVVHTDNTARPQWTSQEYNPSLHRILSAFYNITSIPALINTSLIDTKSQLYVHL